MNVDQLVGYSQSLRSQAKGLLEQAHNQDVTTAQTAAAIPSAPLLFPQREIPILGLNGQPATATASRNAPMEKIALQLGEVYARLETAKAAYAKADGEISISALSISAEATSCLGVMAALHSYLRGAGIIETAAAAALGGGSVPAGYQKTQGGLLMPAKAA